VGWEEGGALTLWRGWEVGWGVRTACEEGWAEALTLLTGWEVGWGVLTACEEGWAEAFNFIGGCGSKLSRSLSKSSALAFIVR